MNFLQPYIGEILVMVFTAIITFLIQKRKQTSEIRTNEIDNAEKVLKYYREMVDDLGNRLKEAITELSEARKSIHELEEKVENLTTEIMKYKQLNGKNS